MYNWEHWLTLTGFCLARQVTHSIHWTISKIGGWDSLTNLQVKKDNLDTSIKAWSTGKVMYILNIRETKIYKLIEYIWKIWQKYVKILFELSHNYSWSNQRLKVKTECYRD